MVRRQLLRTLSLLAFLFIQGPPVAVAFHEGGVGYCDGCHELHSKTGNPEWLLRGSDASSTCLRCHSKMGEPHNILSQDGSSFTAGGDFYWLERSYSWHEGEDPSVASPGDSHGHNIVAADYGFYADGLHAVSLGGNYPSSSLSCVSCHDPHGQSTGGDNGAIPISGSGSYPGTPFEGTTLGNFRLLGGKNYRTAGTTFINDAPTALAPEDWRETDDNHVDYGSGMSEWCANCHGAMLDGVEGKHPAGESASFTKSTAVAYGAYISTGDFSGSADSSYLALVPFERGVSDPSLLDPNSTAGPEAGSSNVMCLTCHRAHASAFRSSARWDFSATLLADSRPKYGDAGVMGEDTHNSYYGRDIASEFGPYQRSLCNKCHVAD